MFVGRFFGPLHFIMPLVAGICGMRQLPFQLANLAWAIVWATGVVTPGMVAIEWLLWRVVRDGCTCSRIPAIESSGLVAVLR